MTVEELIAELQKMNPKVPVRFESIEFISDETGTQDIFEDVVAVKDLDTWVCLSKDKD